MDRLCGRSHGPNGQGDRRAVPADAEHDDEIKEAMKTGPVIAPQPAADALEALGVQPKGAWIVS